MPFLRKYNTLTVSGTTAIRIPIIKRGVVDFAVSADWTPAAGDVRIAIDGAAAANVTNLPTAVTMGNTAYWQFVLTAAELTCKSCIVTVADSATKAVEDQSFIVETFGHTDAMYQADLSAANLSANVTQISGDSAAADNAEAFFDGTGYAGTGNVMPTVTTLINLPAITSNWLTAAGIAPDAGAEIAALVETYIVNEGDATAVMQAIADKIAADWVAGDASPLAIASAVRTNLATELARIDASITTRMASYTQPTGFLAATFPSDPADHSLIVDATNTILGRLPAALESGRIAAALSTARGTQIDNIENAAGYTLAVLSGACADPQTASETYAITVFGSTFTVDMAGQASTGTRTAPTLTKT